VPGRAGFGGTGAVDGWGFEAGGVGLAGATRGPTRNLKFGTTDRTARLS
jgi:hypothetical protein